MKLSVAILSLAAVGFALPIQQAATEQNDRRWLGTALKIGGGIAKGLFSAFAK